MNEYDEIWDYDPALRDNFKEGNLRDLWIRQYRNILFDDADYETSKNQNDYHFFEWYAAITIYEKTGWKCLVEKYQFKNHPKQREIFRRIVPQEIFALGERGLHQGPQMPDLFAFSPDEKEYRFYEIKGNRDTISGTQRKLFDEIMEISGKKVIVVRFKPQKVTLA